MSDRVGRDTGTGTGSVPDAGAGPGVGQEFEEWFARVRSTYRAVHFTCAHRLSDPSMAGPVAARVAAGLLARPLVFRYFGLPYSGRIASLAETGLAEAEAGTFVPGCGWAELADRLHAMPPEHREVLVAVCVRGDDVAALATGLRCDRQTATARRVATLAYMRDVVADPYPCRSAPRTTDERD